MGCTHWTGFEKYHKVKEECSSTITTIFLKCPQISGCLLHQAHATRWHWNRIVVICLFNRTWFTRWQRNARSPQEKYQYAFEIEHLTITSVSWPASPVHNCLSMLYCAWLDESQQEELNGFCLLKQVMLRINQLSPTSLMGNLATSLHIDVSISPILAATKNSNS